MTSIIHPGVRFASTPTIGAFAVIGEPARGRVIGAVETSFGREAVIRSHSVLYDGNRIGNGFQTGHGVLVREDNVIGNHVSIGTHSIVEHHVKIADGVRIHSNSFVPEFSSLLTDAWIGPNVVLTNARYPRSKGVKEVLAGPTIGERAKIGANSTILPGITIGADALVGAGSVVTKDVDAGAVVVGNPARPMNRISNLKVY